MGIYEFLNSDDSVVLRQWQDSVPDYGVIEFDFAPINETHSTMIHHSIDTKNDQVISTGPSYEITVEQQSRILDGFGSKIQRLTQTVYSPSVSLPTLSMPTTSVSLPTLSIATTEVFESTHLVDWNILEQVKGIL